MIDEALKYVAQGFRVIPVKLDKKPLTEHGLKDATQTILGVREYWKKWPDAGIGLVTNGLVVLDFDVKNDGLESKFEIEQKYGNLPTTRTHQTGGGGFHYLYRNPNGRDIRNTVCLGGYRGVDIRANGGYIVVPPSNHPSGHIYEVIDESPIAPAPQWLLELTEQKQPIFSGDVGEKIPQGQNDQWLYSRACAYRGKGDSEDIIFEKLRIDAKRLEQNPNDPYTDSDFRRIARSSSKFAPNPPSDSLAALEESLENIKNTGQTGQLDVTTGNAGQTGKTGEVGQTGENLTTLDNARTDKIVWKLINEWLEIHKGEKFDLDTICRQLDLKTREQRHSAANKLYYEVTRKKLEKSSVSRPPIYRSIDNTLVHMDWINASTTPNLQVKWPDGIDNTQFGYDGRVYIPSKGLIIIAGVTNTGKSVWCRNFLWQNMDAYHCTYFSSETSAEDFHDYASRMTWAAPTGADGAPKFDLIYRNKDFKDVIRPDDINIIDWLNLGENFYQIGVVLEGIKEKLENGIAVIALQKDPNKDLGMGGMWSEHLSSLYLTLDYERMTVKKAKKWYEWNPNGKTWGFAIVDRGTHFSNIRLLKKCGFCWNGKKNNQTCTVCNGTGFVDDKPRGN